MATAEGGEVAPGALDPDQQPTEISHPAIRDGGRAAMPRLSQLGPYRIERALGWGGMGIVYAAEDTRSGERVALKLLRFSDPDGKSLRRFQQEAEATRRLHHPNIVGLREIGREQDYDYYTMDLVEGRDLGDWIRHDKPPLEAVVRVLAKVARAVDHAHRRQLLHRDLKPSNIIIDQSGEPFVTDFGLARAIGAESSLTASDQAVGTPQYMSPEQARGQHQDCGPQSDVWSLGIMLYETLAGRQPFQGESVLDIMQAVVTQDVPLPRRLRPDVPPPLERVAMQCLEKRAEHRYASAQALAEDLERWLEGASVLARRYSTWTRALRWGRIKWRAIGLAALLLMAIGVTAWALGRERGFDPGRWVLAYAWDCRTTPVAEAAVTLINDDHQDALLDWPRGEFGIKVQRTDWCWLDSVQVSGAVRLELTVRTRQHLDGIELALSSERRDPEWWGQVPRGYSCQFSGYAGSLCFISRNERPHVASYAYGRASPLRQEQTYQLAFCRVGERLWLEVDGEEILRAEYPLPMVGEGMEHLGLRSYSRDLELLDVRVYRLAGSTAADPLALPDAALQLGRFDQAIDGYEATAEAYGGELAARALGRAYLAALQLEAVDATRRDALRDRLFAAYGESDSALTALEVEAARAWDAEDFEQAFELIDGCFARSAESQVMYRILELHRKPPRELSARYLAQLGRTRDLRALHLYDLEISDLRPLQPLELEWLELGRNRIEDLRPLAHMPLVWLRAGRNRISDLGPLRRMPLRWLGLEHNPVEDLSPLAGLDLVDIDLSGTRVRDLTPLRDMPLAALTLNEFERLPAMEPIRDHALVDLSVGGSGTSLDLGILQTRRLQRFSARETRITGIAALGQAPLRALSLEGCAIERLPPLSRELTRFHGVGLGLEDLSPVAGCALEYVNLLDNRIVDLAPLAGQPLRQIHLGNNLVSDLSPLAGLPLQRLTVYANPIDLGSIEQASLVPALVLGDLHPELQLPGSRLDDAVLAALLEAWSQRPELQQQVDLLRALQAWRSDPSGAGLRAEARQEPDGRRWCLLPVWGEHRHAVAEAERLGARLMRGEEASAWQVGAALPPGSWAWLARERERGDPPCVYDDGVQGTTWERWRLALLLVWD